MTAKSQLESLREALSSDRPPLCSGAVSPPPAGLHLYYGEKDAKFIDFASATSEDLDLLTAACTPATFGRGNEDVYDESYRKAVKIDSSDFAVQFDLVGSGLLKAVEDQLLFHAKAENKSIRAELYKLNVYDKGSFFKPHKDTPRSTDMLGSLVIIYPTPHKGGELVLRHKDHEWKFDANSLTASQSSPSLAYVAFYSDLEHEVLKVTSGRRVTVTYNLCLVDPTPDLEAPVVTPSFGDVSNLQSTLQRLLKNPKFLPDGGTLGFGLAHLYPVTFQTELRKMVRRLKGVDAQVYQACRELKLKPSLKMVYEDEDEAGFGIMVDTVTEAYYDPYDDRYENALVKDFGGVPVNLTEDVNLDDSPWIDEGATPKFITWISPPDCERNKLQDVTVALGNELNTGFIYSSPCLTVDIRPARARK